MLIIYGLVDAKKMWADYEALDTPCYPVLVGGKAVVSIWFKRVLDSDCGGAYLETWYNTFVTHRGASEPASPASPTTRARVRAWYSNIVKPEGEPEITPEQQAYLALPYQTPFSLFIQDPRSHSFNLRAMCSEVPRSTGAAKAASEISRSIFSFPQPEELSRMTFEYNDNSSSVDFEASHLGKTAFNLHVEIPQEGTEGTLTSPMDVETAPDALIGGPCRGDLAKTEYGVALKSTQNIKRWNSATDSLKFGDDPHYGVPIKSWNFEPVLKMHSSDFKMVQYRQAYKKNGSNWL